MKFILLILPLVSSVCLAKINFQNSNNNLLPVEKKIIDIYKSNVDSVVNVSNIKVADSFFYGKVEVPQGTGTGFVWDDKGHIVTNYHVVQGGNIFTITFRKNKKQFKAKVVGIAPTKDIAVLKLIEKYENLTPIQVGYSRNLKVGQMALAIGNPFGFDHSISRGIISALERKMDGVGGVKIHDMIQTDAAINRGNSGGPLLNSSGHLIGMNTMIVSTSATSAGLGFAVPVDTISKIVPQLIKHGKVIRPGLGVGVLDDEIKFRYVGEKGVVLSFVDPDGAAGMAGLRGMQRDRFGRIYVGDVITKIGNIEVNTKDDLYHEIGKYKIGDKISIEYLRNNKKKKIKLKLKAL